MVEAAGETDCVPLADTPPMPWLMDTDEAPLTAQLSVLDCPAMIVPGEAPKLAIDGFEQGVFVAVGGGAGVLVGGRGGHVGVGDSASTVAVPLKSGEALSVGVPVSPSAMAVPVASAPLSVGVPGVPAPATLVGVPDTPSRD